MDSHIARMKALTVKQATEPLCMALETLAARKRPSEEERFAHAVIIDVLVERYPEVDAAFEAWAESDATDGSVSAIVAAARTASTGGQHG